MECPGIAGSPHSALSPFEYRHHEVLEGLKPLKRLSIFLSIYDTLDSIWGIWAKAPDGVRWVDICDAILITLDLSTKERDFVEQMKLSMLVSQPTVKQAAWLAALRVRTQPRQWLFQSLEAHRAEFQKVRLSWR